MSYPTIVRSFGFQLDSDTALESIYAYAPVFRLHNLDGEWVVKRTQKPLAHAQAVAKWTTSLAAQGIAVVAPAAGFGDNPRSFLDEDGQENVWVVYPFIEGVIYQANPDQIYAAGALLGKIHATDASNDFGLKVSETIVIMDADEITQDIALILQRVRRHFPTLVDQADQLLQERTHRYFQQARPRLSATHLPLANCTWDYKAANLVYATPTVPILVDPDNGGRIPRAYDLAITALLFHNDGHGPGRLFTPAEWQHFLQGYWQYIQWTELEKSCWEDILLSAWIDEALWLLKEDDSDWADPRQSALLLSLLTTDLTTDLSIFALPRH